jgi:hypothetical protein
LLAVAVPTLVLVGADDKRFVANAEDVAADEAVFVVHQRGIVADHLVSPKGQRHGCRNKAPASTPSTVPD